MHYVFFFKQKTAYELRISDWSSDVCSPDLRNQRADGGDDAAEEDEGRAISVEPFLAALDFVPGHRDPASPAFDPRLDAPKTQRAGPHIPEHIAKHRARRARHAHTVQRPVAARRLPPRRQQRRSRTARVGTRKHL